ncbi:hypothetical protein O181_062768 [Austropuccinia psidii MF-1]|uniref:Uncharacterized protein n=1 Tax=Austropuccinia psidii MF-1 TaxID=1389203 RepID=A0A9Q3EK80_9BASI|nr:hypothetical protein [Austropuccinia psidii MF-1]
MVTSQQLKPVLSSSRRREYSFLLPFPAGQLFQQREHWPIWVARKDPNMENDFQDSVDRFSRRFDRTSRELITNANDRMIPTIASEN